MDEEVDEMFAFLTFFKICKMYNVLRGSRRINRNRSPDKIATKVIQRPEPRRNFSMFSQTPKKPVQKTLLCGAAYEKASPKNHISKEATNESQQTDDKSSATSQLNLFSPQEHQEELSQTVDQKCEMTFSDWQVADQVPSNQPMMRQSPEVKEQLDENRDIIDAIFDQIDDNELPYDGLETAAETHQHLNQETTDLQISFVINEEDTSQPKETPMIPAEESEVPVVVKKKRRRRRRPGEPPLSPLPTIKKKLERRYKIRPEHMNRFQESYFNTVFKKVKCNDEARFLQLVRVTRKSFDMILQLIRYPLHKHKQTIQAEERLSITLLYLAHGIHFDLISDKYKLGKSTVRLVVLETCELLWDILSPTYMRDPASEDYVRIANGFKKLWNLPNCAGAIDTKRVPFKTNRRVPGYKWNEVNDLVLLAACDANHLFRSISITIEGHQSQLYKSIINNTLLLPPGRPLTDEPTNSDFPYYLLGNEAFPQRPNLMRPYSADNMTGRNSIYNYSISCGQGVCDTAFNILTSMWKVLLTKSSLSIENWDSVIKACIVLHNFVMVNEKQRWYQLDGYIKSTWPENISAEKNSEWINESYPLIYESHLESVLKMVGESNESGIEAREILADYFCIEETNN